MKWESLRAEGSAGGIIMMWDSRLVTCLEFMEGTYSTSCLFKNEEDGYRCGFAGVYSPHSSRDRLRMWEELPGVGAVWGAPWVCGGISMW